jgi:hypothetical protein
MESCGFKILLSGFDHAKNKNYQIDRTYRTCLRQILIIARQQNLDIEVIKLRGKSGFNKTKKKGTFLPDLTKGLFTQSSDVFLSTLQ